MAQNQDPTWLTVPQMVADLTGAVSDDLIRLYCRRGRIVGAFNKGEGKREYWVAPREGWESFKKSREPRIDPKVSAAIVPRRVTVPYVYRYVKVHNQPAVGDSPINRRERVPESSAAIRIITTSSQVPFAIESLKHSKRGRQAMRDILTMLDNRGHSLGAMGDAAILSLLSAAFFGQLGEVRDAMQRCLDRGKAAGETKEST